jgi:uncharacterized membrane protein
MNSARSVRFASWVFFVTVVCAFVAAATSVRALDIVAGLPLTLYLPGSALVSAIDPSGRQLKPPQRYMWSVGGSIGIVIVGGFVLNLAGGLTRWHWLILIVAVVAVSAVVAKFRDTRQGSVPVAGVAPSQNQLPDSTGSQVIASGAEPARRPLGIRQIALLVSALVVVAVALILSEHTDEVATREHFVQAWILPRPTGDISSSMVQVGIQNDQGRRETLVVRVVKGSATTSAWTVTLGQGQSWTHELHRRDGEAVRATVAIASRPKTILDAVILERPTS